MAREVHEHFDVDGNLTGTTVVTRESLWDDASRGLAMRLYEHDNSIDHDTGLAKDVAYARRGFVVHNDVINYARKAIETQRAKDAEEHKDEPGWMDGRRYIAQPATPEQIAAAGYITD